MQRESSTILKRLLILHLHLGALKMRKTLRNRILPLGKPIFVSVKVVLGFARVTFLLLGMFIRKTKCTN